MKQRLHALKTRYWDPLSASEQRTLRWGAMVLLPVLVYGLLWQPAHQSLARLQQILPSVRTQYTQMQLLSVQAQTLRQLPQHALLNSSALKMALQASAREAGLDEQMILSEGDLHEVRLNVDDIDFAQWLKWVRQLESVQHIRVDNALLVAAAAPGRVKIQATLVMGGEP